MKPPAFSAVALIFSVVSVANAASIDYVGQWHNTTFNSTGAATATVTTALPAVQVSLDLDGNVFGGQNPTPLVLTGSMNPDASVTFNPVTEHPTYGNVAASINSLGVLTADCTAVPGQVATVHITGQTSPTLIDLTYGINFESGRFDATGTIIMRATPEPTSVIGLSALLTIRRRR